MPRGTITERLKITLQNILVHRSWLVEWSSHPYPECWIPVNLQTTTENSSLSTLLDFILKKKKLYLSPYLFLPLLACTYLNDAWDLVLRALTLSDCLFKINRFVFPNCKSLWIKASAKWLNVNVNSYAHKICISRPCSRPATSLTIISSAGIVKKTSEDNSENGRSWK